MPAKIHNSVISGFWCLCSWAEEAGFILSLPEGRFNSVLPEQPNTDGASVGNKKAEPALLVLRAILRFIRRIAKPDRNESSLTLWDSRSIGRSLRERRLPVRVRSAPIHTRELQSMVFCPKPLELPWGSVAQYPPVRPTPKVHLCAWYTSGFE